MKHMTMLIASVSNLRIATRALESVSARSTKDVELAAEVLNIAQMMEAAVNMAEKMITEINVPITEHEGQSLH